LKNKLYKKLIILSTIIPVGLFYFLLLFIPFGFVFYYSLQQNPHLEFSPEGLSFYNYYYYFSRPHYINVIFRTLWFAILTTVGSVVIGYSASMVLRRVMHRIGSTAVLLLAFPILSGPIVTVLGWMIMLTSNGLIGESISFVRDILGLPEESTRLLGSDVAVIIGMIHFNLAFVILNLLNVMLKIEPELEEAAMNVGANRWQTFWHVFLPITLPGIFSASLISFALAMNAFINPLYLGNSSRYVLTTLISNFMLSSYNWQMASATSVILLFISLFIIVVYNHFYKKRTKAIL